MGCPATGHAWQLFSGYTSLRQQQINTHISCLESRPLIWALHSEGTHTTVMGWDAALITAFLPETAQEARAVLRTLTYHGNGIDQHLERSESHQANIPAITEAEKIDLWTAPSNCCQRCPHSSAERRQQAGVQHCMQTGGTRG